MIATFFMGIPAGSFLYYDMHEMREMCFEAMESGALSGEEVWFTVCGSQHK